jgi:TonB family protein
VRFAKILYLTLLMLVARAPRSSALPVSVEKNPEQSISPDDSRGLSIAGHQTPDTKPNPDAAGIYHLGDGVSPPRLVYAPDPEFTDEALRKKLGGTVVVSLILDATGKPQDVRVTRSLAEGVSKKLRRAALGLDKSAAKSVQEYRFEPAKYADKPVPFETTVEVNYRFF